MRVALLHSADDLLQFSVCFVLTNTVVLSRIERVLKLSLRQLWTHLTLPFSQSQATKQTMTCGHICHLKIGLVSLCSHSDWTLT